MREIIFIQTGQAGNKIGEKFWETITDEHGIDLQGTVKSNPDIKLEKSDVYFNETKKGKHVPRAILMDLDFQMMNDMRSGPCGQIFKPDNYLFSTTGGSNNWAKGYHTDGAELVGETLELIRREAEKCESFEGFQMVHSIGGGTGSGMGSLLVDKLREEYPDRIFHTFTVFPNINQSDCVVEPYNAVLSIHHLIENTDGVHVFDLEALNNICSKTLKLSSQTFQDIDHLIANAMSGLTCSFRFPDQLNPSLRKYSTNLVPFPRLHFFSVGFAPLTTRGGSCQLETSLTVTELTQQMFDVQNMMCSSDPTKGKYLTAFAMFRGQFFLNEIEEQLLDMQNKNSSNFAEWIPNNIKTSVCSSIPAKVRTSATLIGNSTAIQETLGKLEERFSAMYNRLAFTGWYCGEGMDRSEFDESRSNIKDLISEYQLYQKTEFEDKEAENTFLK